MILKKAYFVMINIIIIFIFGLIFIELAAAEEDILIENRYLSLELNQETTEFVITEKSSGDVWHSNPPNREQIEQIATGSSREELNSQIVITYFTPGNHRRFMNNYTDSIAFDQYEIKEIEDGIRIEYTIGEEWSRTDYIPVMMPEVQFEEFLQELETEDQEFIQEQFHLITLESIPEDYEREDIYNLNKEDVFGDFTLVDKKQADMDSGAKQDLINRLVNVYIDNRADYSSVTDLTDVDVEFLKENRVYMLKRGIPRWFIDDLADLFQESGLHPSNIQESHFMVNLDPPTPNIRRFFIPVEYRLEGANFEAKIIGEDIEYPQSVYDPDREREVDFPLYSISLLKYFGAGSVEDEGYLMVPEGSGGLINFNNEETNSPAYDKRIYGYDHAIRPREEQPSKAEQIHLPVFGLKNDNQAFLAVVEKGDSLGRIRADVSGRTNSYNFVYNNFNVMPMATMILERQDTSDTRMNVYQSRIYQKDMKIRYSFLSGEKANYTGMAHVYQDYLLEQEILKPQLTGLDDRRLPFFLDIQGAIHQRRPVMGIPRNVPIPLSSFSDSKKMVNDLQEAGIEGLNVRYRGWLKGGEEHRYPDDVNIENKLGSEEDFISLIEFMQDENIEFYPDVNFLKVYNNSMWNGFFAFRDGSRFINNRIAQVFNYNTATYVSIPNREHILNSPKNVPSLIEEFTDAYNRYNGVDSLSLRYIGEILYSDFRRNPNKLINRDEALFILQEQMKNLSGEQGLKLMVDGGNAYTLPYVNKITNMPLFSTGYNIIDRGIPFMQITFHGFINYAGSPINLSDSPLRTKLKTIETGAVPYYMGSYEPSSEVKYTHFHDKYFLNYKDWLPEAVDFYQEANSILGPLRTERITAHERIAEDVYATTYGDKVTAIVNYNENEINAGEFSIPAEDYIIIQGEFK